MAKLVKLHRSTNHRFIAGVLGGIAEYLGWSPSLTRWLFLAIIVISAGVTLPVAMLFYAVMWVMMPNADANSYV